MNNLFASLPYVGDLFYHHIYLFYEEPQIFSCITKSMQLYFAVAIPSENDEDSAWLLAQISSGKLLKAEKNAIEIRDLLLNPESLLFKIEEIQKEYPKVDIKLTNEEKYTIVEISTKVNIITPGLNRVLGNPYIVKVERKIPNVEDKQ